MWCWWAASEKLNLPPIWILCTLWLYSCLSTCSPNRSRRWSQTSLWCCTRACSSAATYGITYGNKQWWAHHWAPHSPHDKVFKALSIVAPFIIITEKGIVLFVFSPYFLILLLLWWSKYFRENMAVIFAVIKIELSLSTLNKVTEFIQSVTKETRFMTKLWNYWRQTIFKGEMPNKLKMQNIHIPVFYQYLCPKAYNLEHNFDWSMIFRISRLPAIMLKYFAAVCWATRTEEEGGHL